MVPLTQKTFIPITLTVKEATNGNILGGFIEKSWIDEGFMHDPNSCTYNLVNQEKSRLKLSVQTILNKEFSAIQI